MQGDGGLGVILGSVDRALALMELLAEERRPMGLGEISSRLETKPSTVHHLLATLRKRGFVEQDSATKRYRLGLRAFAVGAAVAETLDIRGAAEPYLGRLTAATGETASLAVLDGGEVVYIAQTLPDRVMKTFVRLGARVPVHCTGVGKVLAAHLPADELHRLFGDAAGRFGLQRFTDRTICSLEGLMAELDKVRAEGYAVDDEEREEGVVCVAAPVRGDGGRVVAAISVSGPAARLRASDRPALASLVVATAWDLSTALGYGCMRKEKVQSG